MSRYTLPAGLLFFFSGIAGLSLALPAHASSGRIGSTAEDSTSDRDGDGVPDLWDRCPDKPGPLANLGCPDRDEDNDGIIDRLDYCPSVRGSAANHGCPDASTPGPQAQALSQPDVRMGAGTSSLPPTAPPTTALPPGGAEIARLVGRHFEWPEPISFESAQDTLTARGQAAVESTARILLAHPELRHLTIEGHVDEPGNTLARAKDLSRRRAESVKKVLVRLGVPAERLRTQGYGYTRLIDRSETPAAQKTNNRIEIVSE